MKFLMSKKQLSKNKLISESPTTN